VKKASQIVKMRVRFFQEVEYPQRLDLKTGT
jgi:hypothetical protein